MPPTPKEQKEWQIIYPVYLNANRKRSEGRRIGVERSIENPSLHEVAEACRALGLQVFEEKDKCYSQDSTQRGRIRVLLKEEGKPQNEEISNKNRLLILIGDNIKTARAKVPSKATAQTAPSAQSNNNANKAAPPAKGRKKGKR